MNLRQLDVFRSIMAEGSTVLAATKLGISQPAVSKFLKEIETTIGFALFERAGGKLLPTPEARILFEQVDRMEVGLNLINRFVNDLREAKRGRLSIVAMPLMLNRQLPELVSSFLNDHPGVDVRFQSHNMPRMFHSVAIGEVDVAIDITGREHEDVQIEPLIELELACVVPRNHRLAHHAIVTEQDLAGERIVALHNIESYPVLYERDPFHPRIMFERQIFVNQSVLAFDLISRGAGIGLVDLLTIRDLRHSDIAVVPYQPQISLNVVLMTSSRWPASKLTKAFTARTREHFKKLRTDLANFKYGVSP
ncbi:LysR family transcriptional regulator [Brucella intermedia]|uniref:LysR family transcriptional regulator n=1 Tax=Brucella intermedia TaxID=94625 RepID=UPI002248E673|nr:LysR substrate-binding domain-containing protein [Brucella intermedia]